MIIPSGLFVVCGLRSSYDHRHRGESQETYKTLLGRFVEILT
jgi:hypothetical protein